MEKTLKASSLFTIKRYCFLTKPGIIFGNAVTASAGFALASKKNLDLSLFLAMLFGLSFVIASACVFNNYIDRDLDSKMKRTRNRALVKGTISDQSAIIYGIILGLIGTLILTLFTNTLSALLALFGFFMYVFVYSLSKYQTSYCTLIGSIAGSIPPVVGYAAVTGSVNHCSLILFLIIAMWQMPHFFAIAVYRIEDYAKGNIPILPLCKGMQSTKLNMAFYIVAFILFSFLLTFLHFTGIAFLVTATTLGFIWLILCLKGFKLGDDKIWARKMFIFSLVIIMAISFVIPFSVVI